MITIIFYLSLCFLAVGGFNLGEICNNGVCNWRGDGLYNGCIDDAFLRFAHFGIGGGVIDLRCAHNIQVIYVDDTNLLCSDEFILSKRDITLYMNDVKCHTSTSSSPLPASPSSPISTHTSTSSSPLPASTSSPISTHTSTSSSPLPVSPSSPISTHTSTSSSPLPASPSSPISTHTSTTHGSLTTHTTPTPPSASTSSHDDTNDSTDDDSPHMSTLMTIVIIHMVRNIYLIQHCMFIYISHLYKVYAYCRLLCLLQKLIHAIFRL
nr:A-agglutinin anchorage subunit isoform X3 [Crassostrea gigas]